MKRFNLLFFFSAMQMGLNAQSITPYVFASAGNSFSNASYSFDYTIGEMMLVETKQTPQVIVTQGFHQPESSAVGIPQLGSDSIFFSVYPNPTSELIQIRFLVAGPMKASVRIYDVTGRVIFSEEKTVDNGTIEKISSDAFESGFYLLEVIVRENDNSYNRHLQRIQIIH